MLVNSKADALRMMLVKSQSVVISSPALNIVHDYQIINDEYIMVQVLCIVLETAIEVSLFPTWMLSRQCSTQFAVRSSFRIIWGEGVSKEID
jgi:hypothetical protein